jgi:hypothetical protein
MSILDDVRFWNQVVQDSRRTLLVPPDLESRAIEMVKAHGVAHVITVKVSEVLPANTVYVVDEQGLEADMAEAIQHYRPTFGRWRP